MVAATGSTLMELPGVGPVVAARTLADTGDVARFTDRNRYASWTGTAPIEASSGEIVRHRLSRAGNRRMNHMIHIAATTQLRHDTEGRAYYRRKLAAGKTKAEAMRCLKRRISDALYRQLVNDAKAAAAADMDAGPGGHGGAALQSSAAGSHPHTGTSDQPQPGPATDDATRDRHDTEDHQVKNAPTRPLTTEGCRKGQVTASTQRPRRLPNVRSVVPGHSGDTRAIRHLSAAEAQGRGCRLALCSAKPNLPPLEASCRKRAKPGPPFQALIPDDEILDVALTYPRGYDQVPSRRYGRWWCHRLRR